MKISTHTLTWSVTLSHAVPHVPHKISTHTLTWSVTRKTKQHKNTKLISTHTLTWSVTTRSATLPIWHFYFNSHAHVERDF